MMWPADGVGDTARRPACMTWPADGVAVWTVSLRYWSPCTSACAVELMLIVALHFRVCSRIVWRAQSGLYCLRLRRRRTFNTDTRTNVDCQHLFIYICCNVRDLSMYSPHKPHNRTDMYNANN